MSDFCHSRDSFDFIQKLLKGVCRVDNDLIEGVDAG
jgi:hypothetical protein